VKVTKCVSSRVVIKHIDGWRMTVRAGDGRRRQDAQGSIMTALGSRGADLKDMQADGRAATLDYMVRRADSSVSKPSYRTMTRGTGLCIMCSSLRGVCREAGTRPRGLIANAGVFALAPLEFSAARQAVHRSR